MASWRPLLAAFAIMIAPAACADPEPVTGGPELVAPGTKSLKDGDPTCKSTADCSEGEQCIEGLCQMDRCGTQPYRSAPPLGRRSYFAVDRELVVLDDSPSASALDGYEPKSGSFSHANSQHITFGGQRIIDEAGGNFTGQRPEGVVAALEGRTSVVIASGASQVELPVGFVPVAVAAGDVDADGTDEVVALSAQGTVAVCTVATKKCEKRTVSSVAAKDLAMADIDGDGRDEPVVLGDRSGDSFIVLMNFDDAATGQPALVELDTGHVAKRIAAGDIDRSGRAEIITLEDGGYLGLASDTLRFFGDKGGKLAELGAHTIAKDAIDVFAGDTDGDDKAELLVLEETGIEVFDVTTAASSIRPAYKTSLTASNRPVRLAMADLDGDSPAGTLVGEASLVPGPVVPVSILVYPPYSRTRSAGTARIGLGNRESSSESEATTVTLKAGLALGYEVDFPGVAKVAVVGKVDAALSRTNAKGRSISVGDRFSVDARPELEGPDNGVAVLSCACYHAYTYEVEDPGGKLGAAGVDGKKLSLFVPVGGQTSLWSLKRYNVLAERLGNLPVVHVPYKVGDPASYPSSMKTLAGKPIPEEDLVFTTPRSYRTSDVADVGWELAVGENESQTEAQTIGVSVRGSLRAAGIYAEAEVGASRGSSYTVSVGREASFSGSVPPIRDNVRTPEDEHELYSYGFSPIVYRDHYTTDKGPEGGLFVVTYSVTK